MQKDLDASREKTHQSMRALLKPEQQKAFDEGLKKMEEKRAERAEFPQVEGRARSEELIRRSI